MRTTLDAGPGARTPIRAGQTADQDWPLAAQSPMTLRTMVESIGATPVEPISMWSAGRRHVVHLKLEGHNPAGSIKDRTAWSLVRDLERRGSLGPGGHVVESTSGNLGVALALVCRAYGYAFTAVVDSRVTPENRARMSALGARVEVADDPGPGGNHLSARLAGVEALRRSDPGLVWANQYANPANPAVHADTTAPEILRQMDGRLDAVFLAVSTCGTLAGIGRHLRRASPRTRIVAVDAVGSEIFGGRPGPRHLVGIGAGRRPEFAIDGLYDDVVEVDDETAFAVCRDLEASCGVRVGGSSGAVVAACARYLAAADELRRIVCVCADTGGNYASTIGDDAWLDRKGLDLGRARSRLSARFSPVGTWAPPSPPTRVGRPDTATTG